MSFETEGYLVVARDYWEKYGYKGLNCGVPWDYEAYKQGWEDPLVFTDLGKFDLLPTIDVAIDLQEKFTAIRSRETMTILFARLVADDVTSPISRPDLQFLGYDVANLGRPFYSIVLDKPRNPGPLTDSLLRSLNSHGLFASVGQAREYAPTYVEEGLHLDCDPGNLAVWEVYLVSGSETSRA